MFGTRRQARIVALQTLYEFDTVRHPPGDILQRHLEEAQLPPEVEQFASHLVAGVLRNLEQIDNAIQKAAPAWPLDQMAKMDKNVLRIAIFEILFDNRATPVKAVINEAVELAKLFGSDASSKFVNGVLGTVVLKNA
ncbi:MAG: transcription antitermination factor NusB [Chloroflexi bacterium]|nr:transcription antitermination factor NusB [Chloroflexota bacterium]